MEREKTAFMPWGALVPSVSSGSVLALLLLSSFGRTAAGRASSVFAVARTSCAPISQHLSSLGTRCCVQLGDRVALVRIRVPVCGLVAACRYSLLPSHGVTLGNGQLEPPYFAQCSPACHIGLPHDCRIAFHADEVALRKKWSTIVGSCTTRHNAATALSGTEGP